MSKVNLSVAVLTGAVMLSACSSPVVRDVNYKLYTKRVQSQAFFLGKELKPLPHPDASRRQVRRVSNVQPQVCPAPNNRDNRKVVRRPTAKAKARSLAERPARPVRKAPAVYRAPVRPRPVVKRTAVVQRPAPVRAAAVVQRPVAQKPAAPTMPLNQLNDGLFNAAKGGNVASMNAFLDQGAQVNATNGSGETALHAAAALGRANAVNLLLQKGANPNARTSGGWTPLHSAARFRHAQVARLLVSRGAQVNARNSEGKTPTALAQQVGATATANTLMQLGGR